MATHSIDPDGALQSQPCGIAAVQWQELAKDAARGRATGLDKVRFRAWARASAELLCGTCRNTARLMVMLLEVEAVTPEQNRTAA